MKHDLRKYRYPSDFTVSPSSFNAPPKPCKFKKGDKVLVSVFGSGVTHRKYFSHFENGYYFCFFNGDEWSSNGGTRSWSICESWGGE